MAFSWVLALLIFIFLTYIHKKYTHDYTIALIGSRIRWLFSLFYIISKNFKNKSHTYSYHSALKAFRWSKRGNFLWKDTTNYWQTEYLVVIRCYQLKIERSEERLVYLLISNIICLSAWILWNDTEECMNKWLHYFGALELVGFLGNNFHNAFIILLDRTFKIFFSNIFEREKPKLFLSF